MEVKLLQCSPLSISDTAISKCYGKEPYETIEKQQARIDKVANVSKHSSTVEHIVFSFDIDGISRAVLQELSRHRIASYTVKSSRYTLQELKQELPFCSYRMLEDDQFEIYGTDEQKERAKKYLVFMGQDSTDIKSISGLELLRQEIISGTERDKAKYCMPEAYKTALVMTINARALQNFLNLRTDPHALKEIRQLARAMYKVIPETHKFLFIDLIKPEKEGK